MILDKSPLAVSDGFYKALKLKHRNTASIFGRTKLSFGQDFFVNRLGLMLVVWVMVIVANVVGYGVTIGQAAAGSALLCAIGLIGLLIGKFVSRWVKLPSMIFVALTGALLACPLSPISSTVMTLANYSSFMAPTAALGAFAGIAIGKDFKDFAKAGWKYIIITIFVIAGTFFFSALVADIVLKVTGQI